MFGLFGGNHLRTAQNQINESVIFCRCFYRNNEYGCYFTLEEKFIRTIIKASSQQQCIVITKEQWKMGKKNVFRCQPDVVGDLIEIRMLGSKVKLELCEVRVNGIPGKNLVWLREHYCYYEFSRHIVTYRKTSSNKLHKLLCYIWHYSTHIWHYSTRNIVCTTH